MLKLDKECRIIRKLILKTIGTLGVGHIGGSLSIVEALVVLYANHMNCDPQNPKMAGRDRLIVSKGHSGPAVYSVLARKGYFSEDWLLTLNQPGTNLPSHCDMNLTPGIDMTTGSLGQGFSCAAGIAKASKIRNDGATIYAIIGDGESQEGQIWEASMFASQHKLDNLIAFTDYNKMQIDGTIDEICALEPLDAKWRAFGWDVVVVKNGHDCNEIDSAIRFAKFSNKPTMIILHTIKGNGISFAESAGVDSHSMQVNKELLAKAMEELEKAIID
ncbi:MAG: transketolase [Oscillospiraceae bacterium]|jgi:transketolase|nr:transketolase [Oscillospiraceae bacterium]